MRQILSVFGIWKWTWSSDMGHGLAHNVFSNPPKNHHLAWVSHLRGSDAVKDTQEIFDLEAADVARSEAFVRGTFYKLYPGDNWLILTWHENMAIAWSCGSCPTAVSKI